MVNKQNDSGSTPLHTAVDNNVDNNHELIVQELLTVSGILVDEKDGYRNTPLLLAAKKGNQNIFNSLVESGASLSEKNKSKHTILYSLCREGHSDIVNKFLPNLEHLVNQTSGFVRSPLSIAVCQADVEDVEIVKALLNVPGILANEKDEEENTLLHRAAGLYYDAQPKEEQIRTCELLLEKIPDLISEKNIRGETAYDMAVQYNNDHIAKFLSTKQKA